LRKKISIIGAGNIGSTLAMAIIQRNLGNIVLLDPLLSFAKGKALDLAHMASVVSSDTSIRATNNFFDIKNSDICIVCAGLSRKPGMTREDLLKENIKIIKNISLEIKKNSNNSFIIVVTNPLDIMTYALYSFGDFDKCKVVGMSCILDSSRFKELIAKELSVSRKDVYSFVLGSHDSNMIPVIRFTNVAGIPLTDFIKLGMLKKERLNEIIYETKYSGKKIVDFLKKGSAHYAPALSIIEIIESYLFDKKRLMTCSVKLDGQYAANNLFLGVPVVIGSSGIEKIIEVKLRTEEQSILNRSIFYLKNIIDKINDF
jgi:malate dehydrogenase